MILSLIPATHSRDNCLFFFLINAYVDAWAGSLKAWSFTGQGEGMYVSYEIS